MAEANALFDKLLGRTGNTGSSGDSDSGNNGGGETSGGDTANNNNDTQASSPDEFQTNTNAANEGQNDNVTTDGNASNATAEGLERSITSEQSTEQDEKLTQEQLQRQEIEKLLALMPDLDEQTKAHARATAAGAAAGLSGPAATTAINNAVANSVGITPDELNARQAVAEMGNLKGVFNLDKGVADVGRGSINDLAANVSANNNAGRSQDGSFRST